LKAPHWLRRPISRINRFFGAKARFKSGWLCRPAPRPIRAAPDVGRHPVQFMEQ
jgi:hypothetical protein